MNRRITSILDGLDAQRAASLAALAADLVIVVDADGAVSEVLPGVEAHGLADFAAPWIGAALEQSVAPESREKIRHLLSEAADGPTRWREVNHPGANAGPDRPMLYCGFPVGDGGERVLVGRDLDSIATLQQRLVETQRSLEQDYWARRQVETRYRLLFQVAAEGVLIVDADERRIIEANTSAAQLLSALGSELVGQTLDACFDEGSRLDVDRMLGMLRGSGQADSVGVTLVDGEREATLSASLLNADGSLQFLLRMAPQGVEAPRTESPRALQLLELLDRGPDGVVVSDASGTIRTCNRAFLDLVELAAEEQVRGESLDRWLGRTNVDIKVLLSNLREFGSLRHFVTRARGEYGADTEVEVSAVTLSEAGGDDGGFGFVVRDLAKRQQAPEPVLARATPKSIQHLTELVGRVPLKEVIRESSDIIERLCIEAALELTGDNRASAAEMLGLSRQSLYVKLRRHGLMNTETS